MQRKIRNRFFLLLLYLSLIFLGIYLILYNLEKNINFFYPPSKLDKYSSQKEIRVGGLVKTGSIIKISADKIKFTITDDIAELEVYYQGLLPALFREKQGIVAKGRLEGDIFIASELLAKHDENYFPPDYNK